MLESLRNFMSKRTIASKARNNAMNNSNMSINARNPKKHKPNIIIDGLDDTQQPPQTSNISSDESLNVFLAVCDKEFPDDNFPDP